ncbi:MAG: DUF1232 domain-containing protein [Bacteroidales bacterium]|nr:DUF1232 domain-containing protein [Bacteroidales bacterium]
MDTDRLLENLKHYACRVGRVAARPVVLLYLVLRDPATPRRDKYIIYAALAYVVLPINLISSRRHPLTGWIDEAGAIALAYKKAKKNITPTMEMQADAIIEQWLAA